MLCLHITFSNNYVWVRRSLDILAVELNVYLVSLNFCKFETSLVFAIAETSSREWSIHFVGSYARHCHSEDIIDRTSQVIEFVD